MKLHIKILLLSFIASITPYLNGEEIKIGFLVKRVDEPWFQQELKFAQVCADKNGFKLIKIETPDGEKVLSAIDNLGVQNVQGFVICAPDVKLGPAIVNKAKSNALKLISVDDQFVGANGEALTDVPHVGISATKIGEMVGNILFEEMTKRKWDSETGLCVITWEELKTSRDRTDGAISAITKKGFPSSKVFKAPMKVGDIPGAFDAANILLTQHPDIKKWIICGGNDNSVLGAVRATENRGFNAENVIGIGINGTDCISEFQKEKPTGFYASILLSAKQHGYETTESMSNWIKKGIEPPKITLTNGILINRDNYKSILKEQGILN
jgi:L-arabinose transport system substrate-binding protein